MNVSKKVIGLGLVSYIGIQACAVGAGITYHYSRPQNTPIVLTYEAKRYSMQDILHGAITKLQIHHPSDSSQRYTRELSITLIAATTGTATDCTLIIPA